MAEQSEQVEVPIAWHVSESIKSQYATNMIVQHTGHEFILSFFEVTPPFLIGSPVTEEQIKAIDSIRAECIARIIVARERMPQFIDALQTNLKAAEK